MSERVNVLIRMTLAQREQLKRLAQWSGYPSVTRYVLDSLGLSDAPLILPDDPADASDDE